MSKPKVFVTHSIPNKGLNLILDACDAEVWPEVTPPNRSTLLEKVKDVDGLLCMLTSKIDTEIMVSAGPKLKVISNYAVGFDNIDISAATERGILVCNTPGVLTETTADLAFALLMAAARRIVEAEKFVKDGKWQTWDPKVLLGQDIHGATLGIIGMGKIGTAVAKRAKGFGMKIIYYDHNHRSEIDSVLDARICENLNELLTTADFISIHVPLTSETQNLINSESFKKMKNNAILINTSRGKVVDPEALFLALKDGEIAYAALDVTDPEPLPVDHELLTLPNCLIVPHIGSASIATRNRMAVMAAENLIDALNNKIPKHLVNPEVLNQSPEQ